jgi:hypothetical protein
MTETTPWIQTFTGKRLDLDPPDPSQIDIEDIAHSLSMLCRFNGQCNKFYSVPSILFMCRFLPSA